MEFTDYMLWKAGALLLVCAVGNFLYGLITGRSLEEDRRETPTETSSPTDRQPD